MFEETNQTEEMELPEKLFPDDEMMFEEEVAEEVVAPSEDEMTAEAEELVAEEVPAEATPADVEKFLRVKYNGEERDLAEEEARTLAQKGMNYDKILGERDNLVSIIDQYANASNMTRDQFVDFLKTNLERNAAEGQINELRGSYPGASDDILNELARLRGEVDTYKNKEKEENERIEAENAQRKPWVDFFTRHPDIQPDTLGEDIFKSVEGGMSPEEAYLTKMLNEANAKNQVSQQNEKNINNAIGSAKGVGKRVTADPFLEGFNSV